MRFVGIAGLGVLGVICATPAFALSILNVDPDPHTITVTVGSDTKQLTLAPEKEVDAPCGDGCKVKLENGEEYDLKGGEAISIEDESSLSIPRPTLTPRTLPTSIPMRRRQTTTPKARAPRRTSLRPRLPRTRLRQPSLRRLHNSAGRHGQSRSGYLRNRISS